MVVDVGEVELIDKPLNLAGLDGCCVQRCRIDLGVDILNEEDGGGMPVPLLIGEFLPFQSRHEGGIDNHVRPAPFSPFLGIVENITLLVCTEIPHVHIIDLRNLTRIITDYLEGKSAIYLVVFGDVLHLLPDSVTPPVYLVAQIIRLEGQDGDIIPRNVVNVPVND